MCCVAVALLFAAAGTTCHQTGYGAQLSAGWLGAHLRARPQTCQVEVKIAKGMSRTKAASGGRFLSAHLKALGSECQVKSAGGFHRA